MATISIFYKRLRDLCEQNNMTVNELAQNLNLSSGSPTAWKNGTVPRPATVSRIAAVFGVTTDYLLGNDIVFWDASRLSSERKQRGYSTSQVAAYLQIPEDEYMSYENSSVSPSLYIISRLSDLLHISMDCLCGRTFSIKTKAPTGNGERTVSDDDIKFALFGGDGEITDAMYEEVRRFAAYVKQREAEKKE